MFTEILIPTDFSTVCLETAKRSLLIAKQYGAKLHFVHIIEPTETIAYPIHIELDSYRQLATETATKNMESFLSKLELGDTPYQKIIDYGVVHERLNNYSSENNIDLIIMAPHGKSGIEKFFMGSITDRVSKSAHCSILILR